MRGQHLRTTLSLHHLPAKPQQERNKMKNLQMKTSQRDRDTLLERIEDVITPGAFPDLMPRHSVLLAACYIEIKRLRANAAGRANTRRKNRNKVKGNVAAAKAELNRLTAVYSKQVAAVDAAAKVQAKATEVRMQASKVARATSRRLDKLAIAYDRNAARRARNGS